jgi:hypothetical protein
LYTLCQNPSLNPHSKSRCLVDLEHPDTHLPLNWCTECFYNGIKSGELRGSIEIEDRTMQMLYQLVELLGPPPLPESLKDPCKLAKFLDLVDREIIGKFDLTDFENDHVMQQKFLARAKDQIRGHITDVEDDNATNNLTLRLWSGAWDAAKAIRDKCASYTSDGTRGPDKRIPPWLREIMFLQLIEPKADKDPLRAIAEEVAPVIKKMRNEISYMECVPSNSRFLKYVKNKGKLVINPENIEIDC